MLGISIFFPGVRKYHDLLVSPLSVGGLQRHPRIRTKKTLHRDPRIGTVHLQKRKKRPLRATPVERPWAFARPGAQPQTFETCTWHACPRAERRLAPAQDRPVPQGPASLAGDDGPAARYTPQRKWEPSREIKIPPSPTLPFLKRTI